ncbi:hypothetical protein [Reyranella sp. CPCC 100927]|uniref:hypothetical protein n=1 Tax=Reyranella sp. CPCC 100927 TaxID=2599616 RepID=UPI0011B56ADB|nr:hypothetical protein [Reyranella sp. CPCC 100927]TWS97889.1 hypothetical protein FQU96_36915 [Reyranella sp. CPCC 100927]
MDSEFKPVAPADLSEQDRAVNRVADAVHRLNEAIARAVNNGLSIELMRVSRHHDGKGNWGDQMIPMVRDAKTRGAA